MDFPLHCEHGHVLRLHADYCVTVSAGPSSVCVYRVTHPSLVHADIGFEGISHSFSSVEKALSTNHASGSQPARSLLHSNACSLNPRFSHWIRPAAELRRLRTEQREVVSEPHPARTLSRRGGGPHRSLFQKSPSHPLILNTIDVVPTP